MPDIKKRAEVLLIILILSLSVLTGCKEQAEPPPSLSVFIPSEVYTIYNEEADRETTKATLIETADQGYEETKEGDLILRYSEAVYLEVIKGLMLTVEQNKGNIISDEKSHISDIQINENYTKCEVSISADEGTEEIDYDREYLLLDELIESVLIAQIIYNTNSKDPAVFMKVIDKTTGEEDIQVVKYPETE